MIPYDNVHTAASDDGRAVSAAVGRRGICAGQTLLHLCAPSAVVYGAWDGIRNGFGFWQFFARFLILFWGQKVFDIAVFDWFLLCHSGFYPHYFPEIREVVGPHLFGYNWKSHLIEIISHLIVSALLSVICMRKSPLSGREESSVTAC